mgnify:CR=1 FL=1
MKSLELKHTDHIRLEQAFKQWLSLTGYAPSSVYSLPSYIREFLHYLESNSLQLDQLSPQDTNTYFFQLKQRKKQRQTGALSTSYLHKHLQALRRFSEYLQQTGQGSIEIDLVLPEVKAKTPEIFTIEQIKKLYNECDRSAFGMRDRAMLSVFYGLGLRRSEAENLNASDFIPGKNLLYVQKSKTGYQRYVPVTDEISADLQSYVDEARMQIVQPGSSKLDKDALFLSERGTRLNGQSMHLRLKQLLEKAELPCVSLHTLRHSIATHLLQSGMSLQNIARFLGHRSLESTQIYTHISF